MWPPEDIVNRYSIKWHPTIEGVYTEFWEEVKHHTDFSTILEIGFNAGHTSNLILSKFEDTLVTSIDIAEENYIELCASRLTELYPFRFKFIKGKSQNFKKKNSEQFDIIFIDGCHFEQCIESDINLIPSIGSKWAVIDDIQLESTNSIITKYSLKLTKILDSKYLDCLGNKNKIALFKTNFNFNLI